jgi:ADP-ribose pyrophosphatase YjhB (NUDIX family)
MESFEDCATRELAEELGQDFTVANLTTCTVTNLKDYAPKHYVDIGMMCDYVSGVAQVMEPDKVWQWQWIPVSSIIYPETELNLFATVVSTVRAARVYARVMKNLR